VPPTRPFMGKIAPPSKFAPVSMTRTVAEVKAPAVTTGQAENRIEVSTYLAKVSPNSEVLYNGDRMWAKVTLTMRTAGPVVVGQNANLLPVLSGKGQLLQTGIPTVFNVPKGNRLFVAASATTPISVVVEAYPWLETITGLAGAAAGVVPVMMHSTGKAG